MRYPFVLFDVGETLVGPRRGFGAAYRDVLGTLGIDAETGALERALRAAVTGTLATLAPGSDRYRDAYGDELGYWRAVVAATLERATDVPVTRSLVDTTLERLRAAFAEPDAWHVYDDVRPMLERLTALGCRLAVVSNWDSRLPALLERLDLARWFDVLAVSHLEGVEKPSARLFGVALEGLGAPPAQTLHVGNVPAFDLVGAHAAGIDALLVDRGCGSAAAHDPLRELSVLPEIVRGRAVAGVASVNPP